MFIAILEHHKIWAKISLWYYRKIISAILTNIFVLHHKYWRHDLLRGHTDNFQTPSLTLRLQLLISPRYLLHSIFARNFSFYTVDIPAAYLTASFNKWYRWLSANNYDISMIILQIIIWTIWKLNILISVRFSLTKKNQLKISFN